MSLADSFNRDFEKGAKKKKAKKTYDPLGTWGFRDTNRIDPTLLLSIQNSCNLHLVPITRIMRALSRVQRFGLIYEQDFIDAVTPLIRQESLKPNQNVLRDLFRVASRKSTPCDTSNSCADVLELLSTLSQVSFGSYDDCIEGLFTIFDESATGDISFINLCQCLAYVLRISLTPPMLHKLKSVDGITGGISPAELAILASREAFFFAHLPRIIKRSEAKKAPADLITLGKSLTSSSIPPQLSFLLSNDCMKPSVSPFIVARLFPLASPPLHAPLLYRSSQHTTRLEIDGVDAVPQAPATSAVELGAAVLSTYYLQPQKDGFFEPDNKNAGRSCAAACLHATTEGFAMAPSIQIGTEEKFVLFDYERGARKDSSEKRSLDLHFGRKLRKRRDVETASKDASSPPTLHPRGTAVNGDMRTLKYLPEDVKRMFSFSHLAVEEKSHVSDQDPIIQTKKIYDEEEEEEDKKQQEEEYARALSAMNRIKSPTIYHHFMQPQYHSNSSPSHSPSRSVAHTQEAVGMSPFASFVSEADFQSSAHKDILKSELCALGERENLMKESALEDLDSIIRTTISIRQVSRWLNTAASLNGLSLSPQREAPVVLHPALVQASKIRPLVRSILRETVRKLDAYEDANEFLMPTEEQKKNERLQIEEIKMNLKEKHFSIGTHPITLSKTT